VVVGGVHVDPHGTVDVGPHLRHAHEDLRGGAHARLCRKEDLHRHKEEESYEIGTNVTNEFVVDHVVQ